MTANRNTTATQFSAKTVWMICGKMENMPVACVKPSPTLSDKATMTMLRSLKPHFANMPKPANMMEPNMMMVHPPNTACGMVVSKVPTTGKIPPIIMMQAPVAIAKRLTTPEIFAKPTFWLNEVIGVQPKRPATVLTNPSHEMLAPNSL